jgi:integrase
MSKHMEVKKRPTGPFRLPRAAVLDKDGNQDRASEFDLTDEYELIGTIMNRYLKEHAHRAPSSSYQSESSINHFLTSVKLHERHPIQLIDRAACIAWKKNLMEQKDGGRIRKPVSIQSKLANFGHFTRWLVANSFHGFDLDPMRGLDLPAHAVSMSKIRKRAFTPDEAALILKTIAPFKTSANPKTVEFHWFVMALIMTGCRLSEILEVSTSDVRSEDGILCFDLKSSEGRHLKNRQSVRLVPVHSQLIAVGFLDFLKSVTTPRLFPRLCEAGPPRQSQRFTYLLSKIAMKSPEVSLHSLRHSMAVALERARVHPSVGTGCWGTRSAPTWNRRCT